MELMQFSAIVLLTLLMLKLLLLPRKAAVNAVAGRARGLMTIGIALLDVQFLLQFALGLRAMGVTQAVMVNLALFIPASWTISLAILHLQRQGRLGAADRWVGGAIWVTVLALLAIAAAYDGQPLWSATPERYHAEVAASILYLLMQGHYSWRHLHNLKAMRNALQHYYDSDTDGLLRWMKVSILVLMLLAWMVPMLIFVQSNGLAVFGILFFGGIFFLVDSFCDYVLSSAPRKISAAEENETKEDIGEGGIDSEQGTMGNGPEVLEHVEEAVQRWAASGGYRQSGLTMPAAAEAIGVPRYQLSAWLRQKQQLSYAQWMTNLRIAEAQRVMQAHPDWSVEAVADYCGFADRSYFHRKFKEQTGCTPSRFLGGS